MFRKIVLIGGVLTATAGFASERLGYPGRDGDSAEQGQDGHGRAAAVWDVTGSSVSIDRQGGDGGDASGAGEDGSPAYQCYQPSPRDNNGPIPTNDLIGAPGGDGGDGARGGNGGDGGNVFLYLPNEGQISQLAKVSIRNPGGRAGKNTSTAGAGASGCRCSYTSWDVDTCTWTYFRTVDGEKRAGWVPDQQTECTFNNTQPSYRPYSDGQWELKGKNTRSFSCTDGRNGKDGELRAGAKRGNYGAVVVYVGLNSKTVRAPSLTGKLSDVISKTYSLSGTDSEKRTGLRSILAPGSDVSDEFWMRRFMKRNLRIDWKAQTSPQDSGLADETLYAELTGPAAKPSVRTNLSGRLVKKVIDLPDTTVVTITRVLNTDDPGKIAACAKYNAKGSALCELSGRCAYYPNEGGDCLPK